MIVVKVKDLNGNLKFGSEFRNSNIAQEWVERQKTKESQPWGEPGTYTVEIEDIGDQRQWEELRRQRKLRLDACDWTQLADAPLLSGKKQDWADYRQALRDLPDNTEDPGAPQWPSQPE